MRYNRLVKLWDTIFFHEKFGVKSMKINRKKTAAAAAISLAAVMTCGLFAGCDLVVRNNAKNMNQVIADVNITDSKNFKSEFDELDKELVKKVISTTSVSKREMIVSFIGAGYNAMNSYGWNYKDTFDAISNSLVNRQVYIQYAKAYFLKNGWVDTDDEDKEYTFNDLTKFNAAVKDTTGIDYDIAALEYFLTEKEIDKAQFTTRVMFNNSIDSLEDRHIKDEEDKDDHDEEVRTTPTGIDTTDDDYYDTDYRVYTGTGEQNAVRGSYEAKDGSTVTTRLRAYNDLLASLKSNDLIKSGEDTSDIETLEYFRIEYRSDLEDALVQKLMNVFIKESEDKFDNKDNNYCEDKFNEYLSTQRESFAASPSALESAMNSASDKSFVLTATGNSAEESAYGFVINILLPFSAAQSDELSNEKQDYGDKKGNNFAARTRLLKNIKATDQRGTWFTGHDNYGFKATGESDAYGYAAEGKTRQWLFFEDYLNDTTTKYTRLKNYLGKYTYNGTWDEEAGKYKPYTINIDGFLSEMEGYLEFGLGGDNNVTVTQTAPSDYFNINRSYYKKEDGVDVVDYEQFVYYAGQVNFPDGYDANRIFQKDTRENTALSIINELSFAYNTDAGGLNSYLGYAVSANKTNFVSEFEYAAQQAVLNGAGSYVVVPSDYGWHIIYCTFSFKDSKYSVTIGGNEIKTPYQYNSAEKTLEGSFSYLFYESLKASTASTESSNRQSMIITNFKDSFTVYEDRYEDLSNLGK